MKKVFCLFLFITTSIVAQKKEKNGTIYKDHPGIDLILQFNEAFISADTITLDKILADKVKLENGLSLNKDSKGTNKDQIIASSKYWSANVKHLSIKQGPGYPDALEYKEGNQLWVQTWESMNGYHSQSGVKLDAPLHRLFRLSPDGKKILYIAEYFERNLYLEISKSNYERTNGKIFINHPNINTVRKVMSGFQFGDLDQAYRHFSENARIADINQPIGESLSLEEAKQSDQVFFENFTLESIDEWGYPDYLEYEEGGAKVVQAWWKFRLIRKADNKKIILPVHSQDRFNDEGKIMRRTMYYSKSSLEN